MQKRNFYIRQGNLLIYLSDPYTKDEKIMVDAYVGKELADGMESNAGLEATISDKGPITAKHVQNMIPNEVSFCEFILSTHREKIMKWARKVLSMKKENAESEILEQTYNQ